ncbi:hypothetical protein HaLaN_06081 [Haematococcus lacustris]|uniref:Uncharacterized protein n=1 Tax=Haematococcus lacustris TaxID=44745 RepID=A0A699YSJ5_HAELA|nr:hypothetical protein HaLaN_06081 [Haematococcus lacustris]
MNGVDRVPATAETAQPRTRGRYKSSRVAKPTPEKSLDKAAATVATAPLVVDGKVQLPSLPTKDFYGKDLTRPFVKLDADNKVVKNRPGAPELPNASVVGWSKKAEYRDGGFRHAPIAKDKLDGPAEEQAALPRRARSAWECYADELFQKADKQVANKKEDAAFKSSIRDQVMPKRKKARWSTQEQHEAEPGLWSQLSVEQQAPYIAAAAGGHQQGQ